MAPSVADFEEIKRRTEALWAGASLQPGIAGFQLQPGTRWNPGLARDGIDAYERALGVRFPASFRCMLSVMNGTDLPAINVYGSRGHPTREGVGVYAYPRDLAIVRQQMGYAAEGRAGITEALAEQGFRLEAEAGMVPVYSHRYLVCGGDRMDGPVLSIMDTDAIVYGRNLVEYLHADLVSDSRQR